MKDFIRDMLDQTWTLLGMFIAWLVLMDQLAQLLVTLLSGLPSSG